jgi:hypothetical protein
LFILPVVLLKNVFEFFYIDIVFHHQFHQLLLTDRSIEELWLKVVDLIF